MRDQPLVSVIMPVYNAQLYLRDAIQSILDQTYARFELIIINDGSTDGSRATILSCTDPRIVFIDQEENAGLVSSIMKGIDRARGRYLMRADADDINLPTRIEEQVRYMESHPEVGILGTWMRTIGRIDGYVMKSFLEHEDIRANLLFNTSLPHPSICLRSELCKAAGLAYDPAFAGGAEDYDLWVRASEVTRLACLPKVLVWYRLHDTNVSSLRKDENKKNTRSIRLRQLMALGISPTEEERALQDSVTGDSGNRAEFLNRQEAWLLKILAANEQSHRYRIDSLRKVVRYRWYLIASANTQMGVGIIARVMRSPLAFSVRDTGLVAYIKFLLKAALTRSAPTA